MFSPEWLAALSGILLLDLLLSGDNAILIALACKNLPHEMRRKAIIVGGLGAAVASFLAERCPVPVLRHGVRDVFGRSGKAEQVLEAYGLTPAGIVETARAALELKR